MGKTKKGATPKSKSKPQTPVQADLTANSFMANISPIKKAQEIPPKSTEVEKDASVKIGLPSTVIVEELGESVKKKKNKKTEDDSATQNSVEQDNLTSSQDDLTASILSPEETNTSHKEKKKKKKKHKEREKDRE